MKWYTFFVFALVLLISCGGRYTRKNIELNNDPELVGTWCTWNNGNWMKFSADGKYIMAFDGIEYNGNWYNYKRDSLYIYVKGENLKGNMISETYKSTYEFYKNCLIIHAQYVVNDRIQAIYDMDVCKCKEK